MWLTRTKNVQPRKPPDPVPPVTHTIRESPIDLYKSESRCYDDNYRYHKGKKGYDKKKESFFW